MIVRPVVPASQPAPVVADLDRAATSPLLPEARDAMEPFLGDRYGNPSAAHALGRDAVRALDEARERVAERLGCAPAEVVFTSGGTESDVHAITGGLPVRTGRVLCSAVEHPAVRSTVLALGGSLVAVDAVGRVDLDALGAALRTDDDEGRSSVELVSVMTANNELGTINDLDAVTRVIAAHAADAGPLAMTLHTDAVQAAPWLDLATVASAADLVSVSAHKCGGPKGVGALVVRAGTPLRPLLPGGGQEWGLRSGTTDVAGVVGMAAALDAVARNRDATNRRVAALRDRLSAGLCAVPGVHLTVARDGAGGDRADGVRSAGSGDGSDAGGVAVLPGMCHLLIDDVESEPLLFLLDAAGIRASASSACASGAARTSHVLAAIGRDATSAGRARGALRLSLGHDTSDAEVDLALRVVPQAIDRLRSGAGDASGTGRRPTVGAES